MENPFSINAQNYHQLYQQAQDCLKVGMESDFESSILDFAQNEQLINIRNLAV